MVRRPVVRLAVIAEASVLVTRMSRTTLRGTRAITVHVVRGTHENSRGGIETMTQESSAEAVATSADNKPAEQRGDSLPAPVGRVGRNGNAREFPLVSVVVPVYNARVSVGETLSSLLRQTWPNLEIIVVDDGSPDNSLDLVRVYADMDIPGRKFVVVSQPNGGVASARNHGLRLYTGDWVVFLDSDDAYLPGAITHLMAEREKLGEGNWLVVPQSVEVTGGGLDTTRPMYREPMPAPHDQRNVILQYNFGAFTALFPRRFFEEVGVFDETMAYVEDWEFWIRAVYSGWRFHRTQEVLCMVWWTAGSMMSNREAMDAGEDEALRRNLERFRDEMTPAEIAFVERRLEVGSPQGLLKQMAANLRSGHLDEAKRQLDAAAEVMPAQKRVAVKHKISKVPGGMKWLQKRQAKIDGFVDYDPSLGR